MYKSKNPMLTLPDALIEQIEQVTDYQIDELILLVSYRFSQLRPKQEGLFVVLSEDPALRRKEIEHITQEMMKGLRNLSFLLGKFGVQ